LSAAPGVTAVKVNLEKKQAKITSSALNETGTLQSALSTTDFTIAELRA
jgi:copper chaperone CopZ